MKDPRFAKFVLFVNGLVPLSLLGWDAYWHRLGADPIKFALHTTGMLALIFLILSLTITPARKLSGRNWLSHFRRMLGLFAFFYATLHFSIYFIFDQSRSLASVVKDTAEHRFILFGMTALLSMAPLAITSTNGMIKRLGSLRWKRLHRLAYVAGIAGVIHYYCVGKVVSLQALAFIGVLAVLLGYRLVGNRIPSLRKKPIAQVRAG